MRAFYNGNYLSAQNKYKQLISLVNNPFKSFLPVAKLFYATTKDSLGDFEALENYYLTLSQQFSNNGLFRYKSESYSTASDVEQTSFQEAIDEYQEIIDTAQNQITRFYAYIDQLHVISLMLDTLHNGPGNGPGNFQLLKMPNDKLNLLTHQTISFKPKLINNFDKKINKAVDKIELSNPDIIYVDDKIKNQSIEKIKKSMGLNRVDVSYLSNSQKRDLINKIISYKLLEFAVLNSNCSKRPINRVERTKKVHAKENNGLPKVFKLYQNYPNPFNPSSTIKFDIPKESQVLIKIYDLLGREVEILVNEVKKPGYYETIFVSTNLASGVYFYRIEAGTFIDVKKMVLMK